MQSICIMQLLYNIVYQIKMQRITYRCYRAFKICVKWIVFHIFLFSNHTSPVLHLIHVEFHIHILLFFSIPSISEFYGKNGSCNPQWFIKDNILDKTTYFLFLCVLAIINIYISMILNLYAVVSFTNQLMINYHKYFSKVVIINSFLVVEPPNVQNREDLIHLICHF